MPKITFQHSGKSVDADEGEWMYEVAERAESGIPFACKADTELGRHRVLVESYRPLNLTVAEVRFDIEAKGFEYRIVLSQADRESWSGPRGRCTDLIHRHVTPADADHTEVYLCGGRPMIESCCDKLTALGFPEEALRYERFF
jgi:hypothetical protein